MLKEKLTRNFFKLKKNFISNYSTKAKAGGKLFRKVFLKLPAQRTSYNNGK